MCDDRTSEFLSLARSLPQQEQLSSSTTAANTTTTLSSTAAPTAKGRYTSSSSFSKSTPPSSSAAYDDLRAFHKTAADISKDIAATSAMLKELAIMVKQRSLFDQGGGGGASDSSSAWSADSQLVVRIKTNIENLNTRLDQANNVLQQQKRRLNTQAGQEATNLVGQLKEEFVEATAGFQKVLQERTDTLKETEDRKRLVYGDYDAATGTGSSSTATTRQQDHVILDNRPPVYNTSISPSISQQQAQQFPTLDLTRGMTMAAGESTSSTPQLPRPAGVMSGFGGGGGAYDTPGQQPPVLPTYSGGMSSFHHGSGTSTPLTPLDIQRAEQESQQMTQLIPDQSYLRERADAMSVVESNIAELGTVFNKLAVMVSEHQEMVQRVEDNVDEVDNNVALSMQVLNDTLTSLRTNRVLFAKVFGIIVAFVIMFIVFFA